MVGPLQTSWKYHRLSAFRPLLNETEKKQKRLAILFQAKFTSPNKKKISLKVVLSLNQKTIPN